MNALVITAMITKASIKAALKELGLVNVTILNSGVAKTYRPNDALIAGVRLGSCSPVDVTSIGSDRIKQKFAEVVSALSKMNIAVEQHGNDFATFTVNVATKKEFKFTAMIEQFATYSRSYNYDSGYKTSWMVFNFPK